MDTVSYFNNSVTTKGKEPCDVSHVCTLGCGCGARSSTPCALHTHAYARADGIFAVGSYRPTDSAPDYRSDTDNDSFADTDANFDANCGADANT